VTWELDWAHPNTTGTMVWGRNLNSHLKSGREWHLVPTGYMRKIGIQTPVYRSDSWEVDWKRRNGKLVWARNEKSKIPSARYWHWIDFHTLNRNGIAWKPARQRTGRQRSSSGYIYLSASGMTQADIALCDEHSMWHRSVRASGRGLVAEHRLVALKKYGKLPSGTVVRHFNGIKDDNRPENLLLGSIAENNMDHNTARLMAMYWREKYEEAIAGI